MGFTRQQIIEAVAAEANDCPTHRSVKEGLIGIRIVWEELWKYWEGYLTGIKANYSANEACLPALQLAGRLINFVEVFSDKDHLSIQECIESGLKKSVPSKSKKTHRSKSSKSTRSNK